MSRNRRTLARELLFEGTGLHSGAASSVKLSPLQEGRGIVFVFPGGRYAATEAYRDDSPRSTTIVFPGGERIQTVEHLLSAIAGMGLDDVAVLAEGPEIPILDGSARVFAERIREAGFRDRQEIYVEPALSAPICIETDSASICALPAERLRITYVIDYPGTPVGTEMKDIAVDAARYLQEIAPARTFGFVSELEALRAAGLAKGGDLENALIIGPDGPLNSVGYNVDRECAAHKVLDLLGDLALAGDIPRAHYICICGGHRLHAKLTDRIGRSSAELAK